MCQGAPRLGFDRPRVISYRLVVEFNLGDLFEGVVDAVPHNEALVLGSDGVAGRRLTYADLEGRANRLAHAFRSLGIGPGDHVGLHLYNGIEYVEGMLALYKLRATPVNVNYRYVADELRYLFADADLKAVVTEPEFVATIDDVRDGLPLLGHVIARGASYEAMLDASSPERPDVADRSGDDLYLLYTGGTTGMPKGVMWRHEDIFFASLGGRGTPSKGIPAMTDANEIGARARRGDPINRRLPLCPLMHGGAMWVALQTLLNGGALVVATDRHFDPVAALRLLSGEGVQLTMIIGDATARPLADALEREPDAFDLSRLQVIASGGAILSPAVKAMLTELLPTTKIVDTFGASETGGQGRLAKPVPGQTPRLLTDADTAVFDDEWHRVAPGSGAVGHLARTGYVPFGYYKDEAKSAATFPVVDGRRWSVPGDLAMVDDDGSIVLLGRGAMCINTGGEKVFPEEVEGAIKSHPAVFDAMVVGLPDERFGERVVAVIELRDEWRGRAPTDDELAAHTRLHVSGYKVPRMWVHADHCERLPTGKPDYTWARKAARAAAGASEAP